MILNWTGTRSRRYLWSIAITLFLLWTLFYIDRIFDALGRIAPHPSTWSLEYTPVHVKSLDAEGGRPHDAAHNILILQYRPMSWRWGPLYRAAVQSHETYARAWGYRFIEDTDVYLAESSWQSRSNPQMNKIHSLQRVARDELAKGRAGAQWIWRVSQDLFFFAQKVSWGLTTSADFSLGGRTLTPSLPIRQYRSMPCFLHPHYVQFLLFSEIKTTMDSTMAPCFCTLSRY